jgi:hypothetical protein
LYKEVNQVAVEGSSTQTKWFHHPITISAGDICLTSFPHTDVMVITTHINWWDVSRIIVDNGSQEEILFLSTFERMDYDKSQLKEPVNPLYGFDGARIKPMGVITLPVSIDTPKKPHTLDIVFDVVHTPYPFNAIFR